MSRLPTINVENMTPEQKAIHDKIVSGPRGSIKGPFLSWMHSPEFADRAQNLGHFVRFNTSFDKRHSELAILITGATWKAQFEWWAHARIAREAGLEDHFIDALQRGEDPDFSDPKDQAIYVFVTELHQTHRVSESAYKTVENLFGTQATVELVGIVGYYVLVAMTLNVFQVPVPDGEALPFPEAEA